MAKYVQPGEIMEYQTTDALNFGDVVSLGSRIGVAAADIAAGEVGSVAVAGVFDFPKSASETADTDCGTPVYWDTTNKVITAAAPAKDDTTKVPAGYAWAKAAKADNHIMVKLQG